MEPKDIQKPVILHALEKIKMGILLNDTNTIDFGPALVFTGDISGGDKRAAAFCFISGYRFSSLDSRIFATRGLYAGLENTLAFSLPSTRPAASSRVSDGVSVDISAAFPLNGHFSLISNFFAGSSIHPYFDFNAVDRMYFPHLSMNRLQGTHKYSTHKAASSLILQFEPWNNLVILGSPLVFSVSTAAGKIVSEWQEFSFDDLIWNASFNAGLRIGKNFGLRVKAGAGGFPQKSAAPFFSIDIGSFRY
jgi:hypothetical protein